MTGFEPATTRPPDVYSNRAELHPEFHTPQVYLAFGTANINHFFGKTKLSPLFLKKITKWGVIYRPPLSITLRFRLPLLPCVVDFFAERCCAGAKYSHSIFPL